MTLRALVLAAALSAATIGLAQAADQFADAYANTIKITGADGAVTLVMMNADKTYAAKLPDGSQAAGTWEQQAEQVCFKPADPAAGEAQCGLVDDVARKVGDSWEVKNAAGEAVKVELVTGR